MEFANGIRMTNEKYYMQRQQDRGKQSKKCNILGTTQTRQRNTNDYYVIVVFSMCLAPRLLKILYISLHNDMACISAEKIVGCSMDLEFEA